jgi:hypothetical protein
VVRELSTYIVFLQVFFVGFDVVDGRHFCSSSFSNSKDSNLNKQKRAACEAINQDPGWRLKLHQRKACPAYLLPHC